MTYTDRRWWLREGDAAAEALVSDARRLLELPSAAARRRGFLRYARLYGNSDILGLGPSEYARASSARSEKLTLNVIASCVDTATAKIAKNKPAPQFLTSGADYGMRRKAEKLNKFGKGLLHVTGAYELGPTLFRDAAIFGKGWAKVYADGDAIKIDRVFPWELLFDDVEALYGQPRTLVQRKYLDRSVALDMWGGDEAAVKAISNSGPAERDLPGRDHLADQIEVFEGWHLPSGKKATDGKHVICVEGGVLFSEAWERDHFPFAGYTIEQPIAGWHGIGFAERLVGLQFEINSLVQKIQRAFHLLGVPRIIMDAAGGVPKSHMNNEIGNVLLVNGMDKAPVVIAPQTVHPEIFSHLETLYARAFEEVGISQLSARSVKPAGLNAGVALREYNDIESERFVIAGRRYEEFFLNLVRLGVHEARAIPGFSVDVPDKAAKVEIAWADVDLDDAGYVLQCFPSSVLPQTPSGRLEKVQELMVAGLIPPDVAMELLDFPDLEGAMGNVNAAKNAVRSRIAKMLDDGDYQTPEPFDDLQAIMTLVPRVYLEERERGCPEDRLELLRRYTEEAQALMAPPEPVAPPPGAEMPMEPGAQAMPPVAA